MYRTSRFSAINMKNPVYLVFMSWFILTTFQKQKAPTTKGRVVQPAAAVNKTLFSDDGAVITGQLVIGGDEVIYRFPKKKISTAEQLIVGVLSETSGLERRQVIRSTWARNHTNVLFVVGGEFSKELSAEFDYYSDLLWIDCAETYRGIGWKVAALLGVVDKHVEHYHRLFKTDDDSYIRMTALSRASRTPVLKGEYWGRCNPKPIVIRPGTGKPAKWAVSREEYLPDKFPSYAQGAGYMLSKRMVGCIAEKMQHNFPLPIEDAMVGVHAHSCGVNCTDYMSKIAYTIIEKQEMEAEIVNAPHLLVKHPVKNTTLMYQLHKGTCCHALAGRKHGDPVSCSHISCTKGVDRWNT